MQSPDGENKSGRPGEGPRIPVPSREEFDELVRKVAGRGPQWTSLARNKCNESLRAQRQAKC